MSHCAPMQIVRLCVSEPMQMNMGSILVSVQSSAMLASKQTLIGEVCDDLREVHTHWP